jgi:hypothetical protein
MDTMTNLCVAKLMPGACLPFSHSPFGKMSLMDWGAEMHFAGRRMKNRSYQHLNDSTMMKTNHGCKKTSPLTRITVTFQQ